MDLKVSPLLYRQSFTCKNQKYLLESSSINYIIAVCLFQESSCLTSQNLISPPPEWRETGCMHVTISYQLTPPYHYHHNTQFRCVSVPGVGCTCVCIRLFVWTCVLSVEPGVFTSYGEWYGEKKVSFRLIYLPTLIRLVMYYSEWEAIWKE